MEDALRADVCKLWAELAELRAGVKALGEELREELRAEVKAVREELSKIKGAPATPKPVPTNDEQATAMETLFSVARKALQQVSTAKRDPHPEHDDKLRCVKHGFDKPMETSQVAKAYCDLCTIFDTKCAECKGKPESCPQCRSRKQVLSIIRDLLVARVCMHDGPWHKTKLKKQLEEALLRVCKEPMDSSPLLLAFSTMVNLATDKTEFDRRIKDRLKLSQEEATAIFTVYQCIADTSAVRSRPRSPQHPRTQRHRWPGRGTSASREPPAGKWFAHGVQTVMPQSMPSSNAMSAQNLWWMPPPHPYYQWSHCPEDNFTPMYVNVHQDASWHDDNTLQTCHVCNQCDPEGWKKLGRGGFFFCTNCYNVDQQMDEEEEISAEAVPEPPQDRGNYASWIFGREVDPLKPHDCKDMIIEVEDKCCLQLGQQLGEKACLLVHGRQQGPLAEHKKEGQATAVLRSSMLKQAVLSTPRTHRSTEEGTPRAVPRYGGIYIPDVQVKGDSSDQPFETPFALSMVYAASLRPGEEHKDLYVEMETKVKNVLRIMLAEGKDQAILGAWGCGHRGLDPKRMARIFRSALCDDEFTGYRFRRVVFAIHNKPEHLTVFREVFEDVLSVNSLTEHPAVTAA
eukprot:CAMPEP_0172835490 /NCGR_PEP_ID=MMETSP1075-20121228/25801_1 /TAXON_ID=2916 /ORGANISM="Ceratium fusus, Strain PA161109" /LENGTH=626 /DNA_ID=CAMNT_0013678549 /DNA_START=86 /DNA_END=1966 /DNA_ORIENTATION=+